MRFLGALARLAVAARSGAGQSAHPDDLFLSDWRPPPGQRCDLGEAPALSALVDTAALFQRLGAAGIAHGSVLLAWTRHDTVGTGPEYGPMLDSVFVLERRLPDSTAGLVHDAVLASLTRSRDAPSGALLRFDFDAHPTLRTARRLHAVPAAASRRRDAGSGVDPEDQHEREPRGGRCGVHRGRLRQGVRARARRGRQVAAHRNPRGTREILADSGRKARGARLVSVGAGRVGHRHPRLGDRAGLDAGDCAEQLARAGARRGLRLARRVSRPVLEAVVGARRMIAVLVAVAVQVSVTP